MGDHSYETTIMDLHDRGVKPEAIVEETGFSLSTVRGVIGRLNVSSCSNAWQASAIQGSQALVRALRRHHAERCGA